MQAATERRDTHATRIPIDVMVELSHEGFEEAFEADGVNVGLGGMTMRAAYLPEVGSRLSCRFECPPDGSAVETDAEVVWCADSGEQSGQFGVRFIDPDESVQAALRLLVGDAAAEDAPGPHFAKLHIDGVPTPIVARISHRSEDILMVEQELPFLSLSKGVVVMGDGPGSRRGRLESVDLRLEGDIPRLMLAVVYEDDVPAEPTWVDLQSPSAAPVSMVEDAPASGPADIIEARSTSADPDATPDGMMLEHAEREAIVPARTRPDEARVVRVIDEDRIVERASKLDASSQASLRERLEPVLERLEPIVARARVAMLAMFHTLWPHVRKLAMRARADFGRVFVRVAPTVLSSTLRARTWLAAQTLALREKLAVRFPALAPHSAKRRRTTAAPPAQQVAQARPRRTQGEEVEPVAPRSRRRTLLISAVAFVGVGLAVYVLAPRGDSDRVQAHREIAPTPAPAPRPRIATPVVPPPAVAAPAPASGLPAVEPNPELGAVTPIALPPPPPVEVRMPTALPEPSYAVGPMPPPTYPSIHAGVRAPAPAAGGLAVVSARSASPYAVDVRDVRVAGRDPTAPEGATGRMTFGAATVPAARSFTLRMSGAVTSVRGTSDAGGFTVVVPGVLALDRASPITAAMPEMIARAMVLNRGDRAELTIRFVEGRTPAFRVIGRGSSIEVLIARR